MARRPPNVYLRFRQSQQPLGQVALSKSPPSVGSAPNLTQFVLGSATIVASPIAFTVADNAAIGTTVATLSASNGGTLGGLVLTGVHSTDFAISGTSLQTNAALDSGTKPTYTLFINGTINGNAAPQTTVFGTVTAAPATGTGWTFYILGF